MARGVAVGHIRKLSDSRVCFEAGEGSHWQQAVQRQTACSSCWQCCVRGWTATWLTLLRWGQVMAVARLVVARACAEVMGSRVGAARQGYQEQQ